MGPSEIRSIRKRLGLSQQGLANLLGGISVITVSRWERSIGNPNPANVRRLESLREQNTTDFTNEVNIFSESNSKITKVEDIDMDTGITFIEGGTITSPKGFQAGATYAGMKTYGENKFDLGILYSVSPCTTAGTFTTSKIRSPSVLLSEQRINEGAKAIIVNSGIANACVGEYGLTDAKEMASLAAEQLGIKNEEVLVCSTGLIGVELPMALIRTGVGKIQITENGGNALARAMLTTDQRTKEIAITCQGNESEFTIGGISKGSGMIHPNMATMLAFLSTDANVEAEFLRACLKEIVGETFNMITIDGDTSTNDSVILLANGQSAGEQIKDGSENANLFRNGLRTVCTHLAKEIIRDAEGASKLIEITVTGAQTTEDARKAARAVAGSTLVKTAVHGGDPNWGRVAAALGYSGAEVQEEKLAFYINDVCIMEDGRPIPFHKEAIIAIMSGSEVKFRIDLNIGDNQAIAWGCNLSEAYVTFNSAYTT